MTSRLRLAAAGWLSRGAALGLFVFLVPEETRADESDRSRLSVLGGLGIEGTVEPWGGGKRVRGRVADELGVACPNAIVRFDSEFRTCEPTTSAVTDSLAVRTDSDGEFCIEFDDELQATLHAEVSAPSHETYKGELRLRATDDGLPRIHRAPTLVELESPSPQVIEVWSSSDRATADVVELVATCDERVLHLAKREVARAELTRFEIASDAFERPGRCVLVAVRVPKPRDGDAVHASAGVSSAVWSIDVRGQVDLVLTRFSKDEAQLHLEARVESRASPVPSGLIEVHRTADERFVGSSPVSAGVASVDWADGDAEPSATVRVSYVPASPHFAAGPALIVPVPEGGSFGARSFVQALGLAALAGWLLWFWLRAPRPAIMPVAEISPNGEPGVQASPQLDGPVRGIVTDAHTGAPLVGARLTLVAPSATGAAILAQAESGIDGAFRFELGTDASAFLRLVVAHHSHMPIEAAIGSPHVLVRLTERRRAGLTLLTAWAGRPGAPWHRRPAPTPGEASAHWAATGAVERASWAQKVERLVYGPHPPSELEIRELDPATNKGSDVDGSDSRFL